MSEFTFKIGKDVERTEIPHICEDHGMVCGKNLLGKACMCICRDE